MEIDQTSSTNPSQEELAMSLDYLDELAENPRIDECMHTVTRSTQVESPIMSASKASESRNTLDRFVNVLDQLDARVERFRKDALGLQEKRDFLLMSIDLIKSNEMLHAMSHSDRDEIITYIQRVNARLSTVELSVRTVRDSAQQDSLSQVNELIDAMITLGDPVLSRQKCKQYLNACSGSVEHFDSFVQEDYFEIDAGPVDKKFEGALLGCTLDDQKNIKKRLLALIGYLNKQIIRK